MSDNILDSALSYIADNIIVESGISNEWTYKKWSDNSIIAWRRIHVSSLAQYAIWNNMHAYDVQNISTPFKMEDYTINHNWKIGSGHSIPSTINNRDAYKFNAIALSSAASPAEIWLDLTLMGKIAEE